LPFERWLHGELKPMVADTISKNSASQSVLRARAAHEVWNRFLAGQTSWSRPWSLFVLNRWCEQNL
jgi:hypothetical protein